MTPIVLSLRLPAEWPAPQMGTHLLAEPCGVPARATRGGSESLSEPFPLRVSLCLCRYGTSAGHFAGLKAAIGCGRWNHNSGLLPEQLQNFGTATLVSGGAGRDSGPDARPDPGTGTPPRTGRAALAANRAANYGPKCPAPAWNELEAPSLCPPPPSTQCPAAVSIWTAGWGREVEGRRVALSVVIT